MIFALSLALLPEPAWDQVWRAVQPRPAAEVKIPPSSLTKAGAPIRIGGQILFRFQAPPEAQKVYLAGSFNGWANNDAGRVTDPTFAMRRAASGIWYAALALEPGEIRYKFVFEDRAGTQSWRPDPTVAARDTDKNTVLEIPSDVSPAPSIRWKQPIPRASEPAKQAESRLKPAATKVWARPGEPNEITVELPSTIPDGAILSVEVTGMFQRPVANLRAPAKPGKNILAIPACHEEGGYLAQIQLREGPKIIATGETTLSVVANIADDLRYGFFATYGQWKGDYDKRLAALADLGLNAVEFYDYFPAHGHYAPTQEQYKFDPFGIAIDGRDIRDKMRAGHRRNILSLAYVAAYAASQSVYRRYPFPMTDERGVPKVFTGRIEPEDQVDREKRDKWFWLMDISRGSPWHKYILEEMRRTLDDAPTDLVSFDGFEIDSYGDAATARFYAKGSPRNGDLLKDVLRDFVADVRKVTREVKPQGIVSFNSVNEFGADEMRDVTDFLFLEIWRGHRDRLEGLTDVAVRRREARRQRVILKVYPADREPSAKAWTADGLRRILAAVQTGGGSLMVAGEPDPDTGQPHALNTLFYPDHQPMTPENQSILRDYNQHDALLFGFSHGPQVFNAAFRPTLPGGFVRAFAAPGEKTLTLQMCLTGSDRRWTVDPGPLPLAGFDWSLSLPGGVAPKEVWFSTPDDPRWIAPRKIPWQMQSGILGVHIPVVRAHGTLFLRYAK